MQNTAERRQRILLVLCERRNELAENLAAEFGVTTRTILTVKWGINLRRYMTDKT